MPLLLRPATVIAQFGDYHGLLSDNVGLILPSSATGLSLTVTIRRTPGLKLFDSYALPNVDDLGVVAFFYGSILACVGLVFGPILAWRWWPR